MVRRLMKRYSKKIGLPPGSIVYVGEKQVEKARIRLIDYDEKNLNMQELDSIETAFPFRDTPTITWLNIDGLHDTSILNKIGNHFKIHPLVIEDILNTGQLPKMEIFDDFIFIVLKMISYDEESGELKIEQLSLLLGPNYVITFQERVGDYFEPVRKRLQEGTGRLRKFGPDYLMYALIDVIVDHYFLVLEKLAESVEYLDENVIDKPNPKLNQEIQRLKRELIFMRRSTHPLRELVGNLLRAESELLSSTTQPYIRDLYDHIIQVVDNISVYREMVSSVLEIYLSTMSNRMNEVMKVLTIIATIFIPLTFIAGIYGMNFEYMPELQWKWSYPLIWIVMLVVLLGMLIFFRRKKWL